MTPKTLRYPTMVRDRNSGLCHGAGQWIMHAHVQRP